MRDLTLFAVSFRSFARASQPALEERRNQRIFAFKTAAFDHAVTPPVRLIARCVGFLDPLVLRLGIPCYHAVTTEASLSCSVTCA